MTTTAAAGPREVFARMRHGWLHPADQDTDLLAEDAVIELPFAAPGQPKRFEGRADFLAFAGPQRAAFPVRFDEVRDVTVHETADPEVIVVEYELAGTVLTTGAQRSARFIGVLRARGGKVAAWREYQDTRAILDALSPETAGV